MIIYKKMVQMKNTSAVIKNILTRRSIRKLKPDTIPQEDIDLMIKCLEASPSAGNLQPWFFYIVKNQEKKDKLCELSFNQEAVKQAPVVFVICSVPEESAATYEKIGEEFFCIQDTAAATQNLLLAVHDMGYATVWIGVVKAKEIAETLNMPSNQVPVAIIPVGMANESAGKMERKKTSEIIKYID